MISYNVRAAAQNLNLTVFDTFWGNRQIELVEHLLAEDVSQFLTWPEIVGTMFVGEGQIVDHEFDALQASEDWPHWRGILHEPGIGSPVRLPYADYTSGNLVHQAYHLWRWQSATGRRVRDLSSIVEIGAGYGALALLVRRLGFTGRYTIIDLPVFSLLQQYYLAQCGLEAEWRPNGDGLKVDLLVGLWSLSEMSPTDQFDALHGLSANGYLVAGCGELAIPSIEQVARREAIEHLPPNWYWLL